MLVSGFRNDINILRAIAVCLVVVFHLYPNILAQGFLGVDIFLVISGYLITIKIYDISEYNLRMWINFIRGRIVRIYPVLVVTLVMSLCMFYFLFSTSEQLSLLESSYFSYLSVANIYFWRDGGYFGGNDKLKPLLHFWSLSLEMQFYLIFSIFIFISYNVRKSFLRLYLIIGATIISFVLYSFINFIGGQNPAFFLLPTRFWEFGIGAIAAHMKYFKIHLFPLTHISFLALAPFCMIYVLCSDITTPIANIIICVTIFIIIIQDRERFFDIVSRYLPFLDYLGRISFPLYSIHWPLIVAANYYFIGDRHIVLDAAIILIMISVSVFLHELVEKKSHYLAIMPICVLSGLFILVSPTKMWITDINSNERHNVLAEQLGTHYRCPVDKYIIYGSSRACKLGSSNVKGNVALIGNSHAQMYAPVLLDAYARVNKGIFLIPLNNCLPTVSVNLNADCQSKAKINFDTIIDDDNISHVIIATTWEDRVYFKRSTNSMDGSLYDVVNDLKQMINKLRLKGKRVTVVGPLVTPGFEFASIVSRKIRFHDLSEEQYEELRAIRHNKLYDVYVQISTEMKKFLGKDYIDVLKEFCDANYCYLGDTKSTFFADKSHLGSYGRSQLQKVFFEFVDYTE